jgi:hypothetical protein
MNSPEQVENFNYEIKCCMLLERENAAFHNPEPEVEYFPALETYFTDLDSERKRKRVPSESRSAKYVSRAGKFSTFGQGVIKRAFSRSRDINSYSLLEKFLLVCAK